MKKYSDMSKEELLTLKEQLDKEYADIKAKGLALDMSRGKPSADQLDLSMGLMNVLSSDSDLKCETGVDCRNYGVIDGIPEAKRLLGEMSEVDPDHIIIYGNSSLNVMFDSIARSMTPLSVTNDRLVTRPFVSVAACTVRPAGSLTPENLPLLKRSCM